MASTARGFPATWMPRKPLISGKVDPFVVEGNAGTIEVDPYQDDSIIIATASGTERYSAQV